MSVPLLVHTATIERKQKVVGKGISSAYQQVATGVACLAVPQDENYNITKDYVYGRDYVVVFDTGANVKTGDKLTISTGITLYVGGIADYKDVPLVSHLEAACTTEGA